MTSPKHILIVGAGLHVPQVLSHLRRLSPETRTSLLAPIFLLPRIRDAAEHEMVVGLHDNAPEAWVRLALALHEQQAVDRILCLDDTFSVITAEVAQALQLPWHSTRTVAWTRDKNSLRRRLAEAGVEEVLHSTVATVEDVIQFGQDHGWPLVLKPAGGTGSVGVSRLTGPDEAGSAFERARTAWSGQLVVEEWLEGDQYSIDALTRDGNHEFFPCVRKFSEGRGFVEVGHVVPAPLPAETSKMCRQHVAEVLDALQVENGPTSTEFVLTQDGPRVIETHLRPSGGEIPELVKTASAVDTYEQIAASVCDRPIGLDGGDLHGWTALWQAFPDAEGTLCAVKGVESARSEPGVVLAETVADPGEHVTPLNDNGGRLAFVVARGENPTEAVARARSAAESISFVVELRGTACEVC